MKSIPLKTLLEGLDVRVQGDVNLAISGVSPIQQAKPQHITFLNNPLYKKYLADTQAGAVICTEADAADCRGTVVITKNPYYTYAQVAGHFELTPGVTAGIHPSAVIADGATIHPSASIGANAVLSHNVVVGANVVIGPGCVIGEHVHIGEGSELAANVTLYHRVRLGKRVRLASGVVIGADGFGFANQAGQWHKVPQLGSVVLGDDVDVGANTTIDRGALEDTVIEEGVKLDNLIQIGHNVHIGAHTIIAGCVAIAGSTVIGKHCMVGGTSAFAGHLEVADKVIITGMTAVTKSIREPGMYSSGIVGAVPTAEFRKNNARFHRLENLMERVKKCEAALSSSTERK
jgi:UDP-3-O-[3-hydroxymyristoyl] glucosamine N-acyltransferase